METRMDRLPEAGKELETERHSPVRGILPKSTLEAIAPPYVAHMWPSKSTVYQFVSARSRGFRLLEVRFSPNSTTIECNLVLTSLDEKPIYLALLTEDETTYVVDNSIVLKRLQFAAKTSIMSAIRQLLTLAKQAGFGNGKALRVWVGSLCINEKINPRRTPSLCW